jgi:hypothetical protein
MVHLPPDDEAAPDDPESRFLIALWDLLGEAYELSTTAQVMSRLDVILARCEAAAALLRRGPDNA